MDDVGAKDVSAWRTSVDDGIAEQSRAAGMHAEARPPIRDHKHKPHEKPVRPARLKSSIIAIMGVPFDNVTRDETIELIESWVESRQPHYLATANVDFLVQAREDVELRRILFDADLVLCDGMPLVWASRWLGNPLPERVAGSDLVPILIDIAAQKGYRIFFLGGREEVIAKAQQRLLEKHPNLQIAGSYSPPFAPILEMDHADICRRIREAKPDLLFVSFGCPKQEKWISMNYQNLGVPVAAGVGGTIDFLAGALPRAPRWIQVSGLEWLFRLAQEPKRLFKRYAKDLSVFGKAIVEQWWSLRQRPKSCYPVPRQAPRSPTSAYQLMIAPPRLDATEVSHLGQSWDRVLLERSDLLLDAQHVEFIDSTGIGMLIRLSKLARQNECSFALINPSPDVQNALRLMKLENFFKIVPNLEAAKRLQDQFSTTMTMTMNATPQPGMEPTPPRMNWPGEVTSANTQQLWDHVTSLIPSTFPQGANVTIDLSGVTFMDSSGVGLMLKTKKRAGQHGMNVQFAGATDNVLNVLRITKLEEYLLGKRA